MSDNLMHAARMEDVRRQRATHAAAIARVTEHYATTYGPDFAALVRSSDTDFDC